MNYRSCRYRLSLVLVSCIGHVMGEFMELEVNQPVAWLNPCGVRKSGQLQSFPAIGCDSGCTGSG